MDWIRRDGAINILRGVVYDRWNETRKSPWKGMNSCSCSLCAPEGMMQRRYPSRLNYAGGGGCMVGAHWVGVRDSDSCTELALGLTSCPLPLPPLTAWLTGIPPLEVLSLGIAEAVCSSEGSWRSDTADPGQARFRFHFLPHVALLPVPT